jgi:hypothetical protein
MFSASVVWMVWVSVAWRSGRRVASSLSPAYEPALRAGITSPYPHLRQYVVSRSITESPDPAVEIIAGDPLGAGAQKAGR